MLRDGALSLRQGLCSAPRAHSCGFGSSCGHPWFQAVTVTGVTWLPRAWNKGPALPGQPVAGWGRERVDGRRGRRPTGSSLPLVPPPGTPASGVAAGPSGAVL